MKKLLVVSALTMSSAVVAQQPDGSRWGLGAGVIAMDRAYVGEDTRIRPIPLLSYEGDRLFLRGISGGYHLFRTPEVSFDVLGSARIEGLNKDDLGFSQLASRGINRNLLEDRGDEFDLGLGFTWRGHFGELQLRALTDVTGTSKGQELALTYSRRLQLGLLTLTPLIGVSYFSDNLANYYYGTLDEEVARGVVRYRPDAVAVPQAGINLARPFGQHWVMMGGVRVLLLPDKLVDSPLIDSHTTTSVFLGLTYRF